MITLIIPVYNKAPFLKRCLASVVNQTDKSAQIVVVDDGSTDGSDKICDYYEKIGFEVYHIEHNGVSAARNFGISKAKGDYIAFLDADDVLMPDALEIMDKASSRGYGIYQFGQYRCRSEEQLSYLDLTIPHGSPKGHYSFDNIPKYWVMVWNKLYKRSLIKDNKIKFKTDMQFGEDAMFSAECILANGGLYHASQATVAHIWDDNNSLCRGDMTAKKLEKLDKELNKLADKQTDPQKKEWLEVAIKQHRQSRLFRRFGVGRVPTGKYDIVYFVKDSDVNEELTYSLRSVEENWQYKSVWFYGGCPTNLVPDHHAKVKQTASSKWQRVREMLYQACQNDKITEDFWLFNDDFFILKPISENMPPQYNGDLKVYVEKLEKRHGGPNDFILRLRHLIETLEGAGKGTLNYAVHKPILINRKKMLEVLDKFPDEPMSRALYGNYWEIGGESKHDMKIRILNYTNMYAVENFWEFVSTSDISFRDGEVGRFIMRRFDKKSRFEKEAK